MRGDRAAHRPPEHPDAAGLGVPGDGRPYLTTALCPGGSLGERVEREGGLPLADVLRVGVKIAGALQTAHSNGIVHRDIKPANILLTAFDEPALADFGISLVQQERATTQRTQAYTASHAPPEVLSGALADEAFDIYSLGSTLYQLLAGRPAFQHAGDVGLASFVHQVLHEPLPPLSEVPPSLQRLVQTAMAKAPADRFGSAAELGRALQAVQRELGVRVDEMVLAGAAAPGADQDPTMLIDLERQAAPVVGEPTGRATASHRRRRAVVAGVLAAAVLLGGAAAVVGGLSGERQVAGGSAATTTAESSTRTAEPTTTSATGPGPFRDPRQCGKLASHEALRAGRVLRACAGEAKLTMRRDGNLVVSRAKRKLWESGTAGHRGARLTMRDGGALVVAIPETKRVLWSSHTGGHRGAWLALQDDGRLVVYSSARKVLWSGGARRG